MNRRVLFVDDDPALLDTHARLLGRTFEVETAIGPEKGLEAVEKRGPFAVIVSDLRMPRMNGVEFLARARVKAPDTTRVMFTGFADTEAAVSAVNEGHIFRFLNKPCLHEHLVATIEACLEQYRLITAERELLEKTLAGSVRVLTEILGLANPCAVSRAARIRETMGHLARQLHLASTWQYELAGLLSQIGCVTTSPEILDKVWSGQELDSDEAAIYRSHPALGSQLLGNIPRLGCVAQMIERQQGGGTEEESASAGEFAIARGGQMLQMAVALDQLLARGLSLAQGVARLRCPPHQFPPDLLAALESLTFAPRPTVLRAVRIAELEDSMVLAEDVRSKKGMLLVTKGNEVSMPLRFRLRGFASGIGVVEPIRVWVHEAAATMDAAA